MSLREADGRVGGRGLDTQRTLLDPRRRIETEATTAKRASGKQSSQ
jgi:hypothetical protein